jgi:hypothetical protein
VVPAGVPHTFRNIGPTAGRLLFILTPALEGEAFFTALAAATATETPILRCSRKWPSSSAPSLPGHRWAAESTA